ncbi:hypothetical protein HBH56_003540 [Parastagonospora nodorum]|uniref:Uncharacterized protein n=1 Tax=Phaeosphaeria nodorum (strain SN15 / ATCC MYA-4574 / FGSC 10173) TaxID=321614 RepID=A0A7U2ESE9_PHANO|nr:hypothetical protein HBH56_003540 [Parastagonospora nodorum]QRC90275.1 hypothetical protein JI435_306730 [Parastagonospora nodorum SN15]KAH3937651.1 hypothetical protein HBH54_003530 [Parastagonospora nodorum]KAH3946726.1 hypothetical protein HBH53_128460 [Parastagonospora nodorum]KAH3975158.1 hypothetical protein HBH51_086300 [Parastagonospora nodorum]
MALLLREQRERFIINSLKLYGSPGRAGTEIANRLLKGLARVRVIRDLKRSRWCRWEKARKVEQLRRTWHEVYQQMRRRAPAFGRPWRTFAKHCITAA